MVLSRDVPRARARRSRATTTMALAACEVTAFAVLRRRLAHALWFILGCVLGRLSNGRSSGTREATATATATAATARVRATTVTPTTSRVSVDGKSDGGEARSRATSGTTHGAVAMEVERTGGDDEAESSCACVDDEMTDAFVEEEATSGVPEAFATRSSARAANGTAEWSRAAEASSSGAEDESPNDSDSADTKEKIQFFEERVFEATNAVDAAEDERDRARAEANRIEWEKRAEELARQREEARRLKSIARKERRALERSQTHREERDVRAKEAEDLDAYRVHSQEALKTEGLYHIAENGDLQGLLTRLEINEEGKNIETSYKKALLKFHPDRAAARGGGLKEHALCEETFKLLQACRKVWESMGKPNRTFVRQQTAPTRSWTRGSPASSQTTAKSPPKTSTTASEGGSHYYHAYKAGRQSMDDEARKKEAEINAAFVQKAKQEATEAEERMRAEAAARWRELQKLQREKDEREKRAEFVRVDSLAKAREREELRKKLEEIKRSASFVPQEDSQENSPSPAVNRTTSGTRVHINMKPTVSPGTGSQFTANAFNEVRGTSPGSASPRSPQSKEETLTRL